jgi:hypothetical protein
MTDASFKVYSNIPAAKMSGALKVAKLNNLQLISYTVLASNLNSLTVASLIRLLPGQVVIQATAVVNDAFTLVDESTLTIGFAATAAGAPTATLLDEKQTSFALNRIFNDNNNAPYVVQAATPFLNVSNDTDTTASANGSFVINLLVSNSAVNA